MAKLPSISGRVEWETVAGSGDSLKSWTPLEVLRLFFRCVAGTMEVSAAAALRFERLVVSVRNSHFSGDWDLGGAGVSSSGFEEEDWEGDVWIVDLWSGVTTTEVAVAGGAEGSASVRVTEVVGMGRGMIMINSSSRKPSKMLSPSLLDKEV